MKRTKPKMILFDYGGTLLYEPDYNLLNGERAVFKHVIENPKHITAEDMLEFEIKLYQNINDCRKLDYEIHEIQLLRLKYEYLQLKLDISYEEAEKVFWENTSPITEKARMPYVIEMLDFLKKEGIRSGIISNIGWSGNALTDRINQLLPNHCFEFIIASSEYSIRKPHPMLFELALKKANLSADEVWYCGDTFDKDIIGAHNAGIFPVLYEGTCEDGPNRKPMNTNCDFPYLRIKDWRELISYFNNK